MIQRQKFNSVVCISKKKIPIKLTKDGFCIINFDREYKIKLKISKGWTQSTYSILLCRNLGTDEHEWKNSCEEFLKRETFNEVICKSEGIRFKPWVEIGIFVQYGYYIKKRSKRRFSSNHDNWTLIFIELSASGRSQTSDWSSYLISKKLIYKRIF